MKDAPRPARAPVIAAVGTGLALLSCYGTLALVAVLSALGVSLAVDEKAWAGAISIFAVVAFAGVALGFRRSRVAWPVAVGAIGLAAVLWAMLISYSWTVELAGFAALAAAAAGAWRGRRASSDGLRRR